MCSIPEIGQNIKVNSKVFMKVCLQIRNFPSIGLNDNENSQLDTEGRFLHKIQLVGVPYIVDVVK